MEQNLLTGRGKMKERQDGDRYWHPDVYSEFAILDAFMWEETSLNTDELTSKKACGRNGP